MRGFFKPFRRKVGVVMLGLACFVMVAWVRSIFIGDHFSFAADGRKRTRLISADGYLNLNEEHYSWQIPSLPNSVWESAPRRPTESDDSDDVDAPMIWEWSAFGIDVGEFSHDPGLGDVRHFFCCVPYWSIVLPFTLLSAYLLVTKPRRSA